MLLNVITDGVSVKCQMFKVIKRYYNTQHNNGLYWMPTVCPWLLWMSVTKYRVMDARYILLPYFMGNFMFRKLHRIMTIALRYQSIEPWNLKFDLLLRLKNNNKTLLIFFSCCIFIDLSSLIYFITSHLCHCIFTHIYMSELYGRDAV